jgi:hypothetical protein
VRTYLNVLQADPGLARVELRLAYDGKNQTATSDLRFGKSWPASGYASLLTYDSEDTLRNLGQMTILDHASGDTVFSAQKLSLNADSRNLYAVVDSVGSPILIRTKYTQDPPHSGKARVQYMNLCHFIRSTSLLAPQQDSFEVRRMSFLTLASDEIEAGSYTFYFVNDLSSTRLDSLTLSLQPRKVYNFFLTHESGVPQGAYTILE